MDVTELRVYQQSLELLKETYELAYKLPKLHLKLRTQLINSAEAISPLIAEGFAKQRNTKEAKRFFEMAMAESDEVITHLRKIEILGSKFRRIPLKGCEILREGYKSLSRQLNRPRVPGRALKSPTSDFPII